MPVGDHDTALLSIGRTCLVVAKEDYERKLGDYLSSRSASATVVYVAKTILLAAMDAAFEAGATSCGWELRVKFETDLRAALGNGGVRLGVRDQAARILCDAFDDAFEAGSEDD